MAEEDDLDSGKEVEGPPEAVGFKQVNTQGTIDPTLWRFGIEDLERLPFAGQGMWRQIGPAPLLIGNDQIFQGIGPDSGVVYDIAIDPSGGDNLIMYIATANGGVWKTVDGGASWQPTTDLLPSSAVGAVALDPGDPKIVYAGTGNLFETSGMPKSTGLFKSIDGGSTWAHMDGGLHASVFANHGINRIVCPTPNTVLVASDIGLFFSKDGGLNFGNNEPDFNNRNPIRDGFISALVGDNGALTLRRITDVSTTTPITVTAADHGFLDGDRVYIGGVTPARNVNGSWLVDRIALSDSTFNLRNSLAGGAPGAATGFVMGPAHPNSVNVVAADNVAPGNLIVIRANGHGFITGDIVAIHGVGGNTAANRSWQIRVRDADHFELNGSRGNAAYTGNGIVDGPRHRAQAITAAVNDGASVRITVPAHGFVERDQVTVTGLPGVAAPNNSAFVVRIDDDNFRLGGMHLNAAYGGGGTVTGPAAAWNSAYFVSAGPTGANRGLFRLTVCSDGGIVISDNLLSHTGGPTLFGRVAFAQSLLPRPRTLYISVQNGTGATAAYIGLFHSDNFGRTWTLRPGLATRVATDGVRQSDYDLTIGVDPQDGTRVYAALQQLWRSTNSGGAWNNVIPVTLGGNQADALSSGAFSRFGHSPSTCLLHWDHHEMVFAQPTQWAWNGAGAPVQPSAAYFGTDGGIARSDDGGVSYVPLNEGLATALLEDMDIGRGAGNNDVTFGGMQDTGTAGHQSADAELCWVAGVNSDGDYTAIDPASPDTVVGFNGDLFTWTPNGGGTWFTENIIARPVITEVRNTNPVEVVTTGHPFQTGDAVTVLGVPGGGGLANGFSTVTRVDNFAFQLNGKNGVAVAPFTQGPVVTGGRCLQSRRITVVTAAAPIEIETSLAHGFVTGDQVHIEGVLGRTAANNTDASPFWPVTVISGTRFSLDGSNATISAPYVHGTGRVRGPRRPDSVPIQLLTNATPIVVIAFNHGFIGGDKVAVANVLGTTAANNPSWTITVIDSNSFSLNGSAGNGVFIQGPRASGPSMGRGLGATAGRHRVAIEPNGGAPATNIFVSRGARLFRSTNGGASFTAVAVPAGTREISALSAPAPNQLWIGTVARPQSGATTFLPGTVLFRGGAPVHFFGAADNFVSDIGARGNIAGIAVDPADPLHVAVVVSGYSETNTRRRTRHCFVTTTGGRTVGGARAWTEVGGVFDVPIGNLPDFPVLSVAFDETSRLLVASDGGILRLNGNQWERVGPNLPNVSCQSLRIDTSVVPSVIRVGTYGRSAWEFVRPTGPKLVVRAQLGFGERRIGMSSTLPLTLNNVGDATLTVTSMAPNGDFSFDPALATPFDIGVGARRFFSVVFNPSSAGPRFATLEIQTSDPGNAILDLHPTGIGVAAGRGRISLRGRVNFGFVVTGATVVIPYEILNTGLDNINIGTVALQPGNAAFSLPTPHALPAAVQPGGSISVDIQFAPTATGAIAREMTIAEVGGPNLTIRLNGAGAAAGSQNLIAAIIHFLGLDDDTDDAPEVLV